MLVASELAQLYFGQRLFRESWRGRARPRFARGHGRQQRHFRARRPHGTGRGRPGARQRCRRCCALPPAGRGLRAASEVARGAHGRGRARGAPAPGERARPTGVVALAPHGTTAVGERGAGRGDPPAARCVPGAARAGGGERRCGCGACRLAAQPVAVGQRAAQPVFGWRYRRQLQHLVDRPDFAELPAGRPLGAARADRQRRGALRGCQGGLRGQRAPAGPGSTRVSLSSLRERVASTDTPWPLWAIFQATEARYRWVWRA